jgi:hypothetical protein
MGSKNAKPAAAPVKRDDPKGALASKWWLVPVKNDPNVKLTLDDKVAQGKSGT